MPTELTALQKKITTMLSPEIPAATAGEYVTDLQMVSGLVMITWRRARPTDAPDVDTPRTDQVLAARQAPSHSIHVSTPPQDARACTSILLAADAVPSAAALQTALAPLAPVGNRTRSGIAPRETSTSVV